VKKSRFETYLFFWIFFTTFLGYYSILLLLFNLGMSETSRSVTIPIRFGISGMLTVLFLRNINKLQSSNVIYLYVIFMFIYLYRLFEDYMNMEHYFMSISEVLVYFLSFSAIPFIVFSSQRLDTNKINSIFNALFIGGVLFSLLVVSYYSRFIGTVYRLETATSGESVLSPLALSYSSTLVIGVFIFYLIFNKVGFFRRVVMYVGIGLATVPFFLGASRGSLIVLGIPFILYVLSGKSITFKFRALVILSIVFIGVAYLDQYFSSGLLKRFFGISDAIADEDSSAIRIQMWESALNQFINNPFIGDKLRMDFSSGYPHNIFIEVLQTTGIVGFIPFVFLIYAGWRVVFYILKNKKEYFWVAIIFIQAFMMNMFSGAIFTADWLWTSLGLLIAVQRSLEVKASTI
jgi:O-antigen ligase